jgi:polyferredoxin
MTRQKIRKAMLAGMFFSFPVTITWLSPAMPLLYAMHDGILVGASVFFILLFFVSLFLGRAFCGWMCPAGGEQEYLCRVSEKRIKHRWINAVKYVIWVPWLLTIVWAFWQAGGVKEVDVFAGLIDKWMFLVAPYRYVIYFGVVLIIGVLHLTIGRRAFCHCVCWMAPFMVLGDKIGRRLNLPRLRLKANRESCNGCNLCTKKCGMSLDVKAMVESGDMKNSECILCGECADVCPRKSITLDWGPNGPLFQNRDPD